jgi:hypothetical protein
MTRKYLGKPDLAERYGRTTKTIDRWKKLKIIPGPDLVLNSREFWSEEVIDQHDRDATVKVTAA